MEADPLTLEQILEYLREVAEILGDEGGEQVVVVVGGALLAHYGIRDTTTDVDSVRRLDDEITRAAAKVANRHDLHTNWLNANALSWRPLTLVEDECETMLERGRLRVLAAPIDQVFLMKLDASRSSDYSDLVDAWPLTSYESAEQVVEAFALAYPGIMEDEYLLDFVEDIIEEADEEAEPS